MHTSAGSFSLPFPAPEQLLWVCPQCGPKSFSRIAPSQVFRRNMTMGDRSGGAGSSEWRKIQCDGCERKFMLRINSEGWVTGLPIESAPGDAAKADYSALDTASGAWLTTTL
jgi:ribosomal protein L37AE/L43A